MSVELKRVPMDFQWPLKSEWHGYVNLLAKAAMLCPACKGEEMSPTARRLNDLWYGREPFCPEDRDSIPFVAADVRAFAESQSHGKSEASIVCEANRLAAMWNQHWRYHLNENDIAAIMAAGAFPPSFPLVEGKIPTPREVGLWSIARPFDGLTHKAQWACVQAECNRLGEPIECTLCKGEGKFWPTEAARIAADEWMPTDPPTGDGYQMWETVSSGSPISPVLADKHGLATYMAQSAYSDGLSIKQWMAFIDGPGWAPSGMIIGDTVVTGVVGMLIAG